MILFAGNLYVEFVVLPGGEFSMILLLGLDPTNRAPSFFLFRQRAECFDHRTFACLDATKRASATFYIFVMEKKTRHPSKQILHSKSVLFIPHPFFRFSSDALACVRRRETFSDSACAICLFFFIFQFHALEIYK